MIKINTQGMTPEQKKVFNEIAGNVLGNPVTLEETPTASTELKANTVAKVKDAEDYVYIKFADGKMTRVAIDAIIS